MSGYTQSKGYKYKNDAIEWSSCSRVYASHLDGRFSFSTEPTAVMHYIDYLSKRSDALHEKNFLKTLIRNLG